MAVGEEAYVTIFGLAVVETIPKKKKKQKNHHEFKWP